MRAGGAFLWATLTLPQKSTSNFLANVVGDTAEAGALEFDVAETEERHVSEESLPSELVDVFIESALMSFLRTEVFPACLNVLMISGT